MVILKKHNKTILIFSILITLVIICTVIGIKKDKSNLTNAENHIENTTTTITTTESMTLISNFEFSLAETYSSREEILKEQDALEDYYYEYLVGRKTKDTMDVREEYFKIDAELHSMLYVYPPTEEEILAEKERMLKSEILYHADNYQNYKKGIKDEDLTFKEKNEKQKLYEEYLEASKIQSNYETGEITIDEALEILNLEPTRLLLSYYDQIEAAKSNNN